MALYGKRIVILGGSSGIGLAVAQAAARDGAAVVIASSRQVRVDAALAQLPGAEGYAVDLGDSASVQALFGRIGAFDHLAYTAGEALALGSLAATDPAAAQHFFTVRYWGAFFAAKYCLPHIRPGGSIVFTSGTAGRRPQSGWALGASICMAMEGLTRALAVELAPVRVNLVVPGFVKTPLWAGMADADREAMYRPGGCDASRRPCRRAGGDRGGLPVLDAPELQHGAVGGGGWRRRARLASMSTEGTLRNGGGRSLTAELDRSAGVPKYDFSTVGGLLLCTILSPVCGGFAWIGLDGDPMLTTFAPTMPILWLCGAN